MRIAVFRPSPLGGLLGAVPALRALRATHPETSVLLVAQPGARELAARLERYVDGFVAFPGFPGVAGTGAGGLPEFFALMGRLRCDLVVQMQDDGRLTNPLAALMGGRVTGGYFRAGRYCPDPDGFIEWRDGEDEVARWLRLAEHLGAPSKGAHLEFPLAEHDWRELEGLHLADLRYAVLHPGAGPARRRGDAERFAEVGDALVVEQGLHVVLTGTADEEPLVKRVQAAMRQPAIDLSGRTTLGGLGAVIARARLVVCNGGGDVSQIAAALRTPCVAIAGNTPVHEVLEAVQRAEERAA